MREKKPGMVNHFRQKRAATFLCFFAAVFLVSIVEPVHSQAEYRLPDTGQTKCYDNSQEIPCLQPGDRFYGQDGNYSGPQLAYRDNGNGTVTDLNTGLMWQQSDSQNDTSRRWQEAVDYCSGLNLADRSDWWLPIRWTLLSIASLVRFNPSIDTQYFPNCRLSGYWPCTSYAQRPDDAWSMLFSYGNVYWYPKSYHYYVQFVLTG